jgi:hypothetical protein
MGRTAPSPGDPSQPRDAAHPLPHRISTTPRPRSSTGLAQRKGSADPQSGAPPHHRSHAGRLSPSQLSPAAAHDRDDPPAPMTPPPCQVAQAAQAFVAWRLALVEARKCCRQTPPTSTIRNTDCMMVLLRTMIDRIDPCAAGKPTAIRTSRTRPTITVRIVAKTVVRFARCKTGKRSRAGRSVPRLAELGQLGREMLVALSMRERADVALHRLSPLRQPARSPGDRWAGARRPR